MEPSTPLRRRCERLRQPAEFDRVRTEGQAWPSPLAIVRAARAQHGSVRFGVVTTKRLGKAVQRNRARRLIREAMRRLCPHLQAGWDLVIIARPRLLEASAHNVQEALEALLGRAGLLAGPPERDHASAGGFPF